MHDYVIVGAGSAGCVLIGGNTNAPAIMIAERATDLIRGRVPAAQLPAVPA